MVKLVTKIVVLFAAGFVGHWALKPTMEARVAEHFNSCHTELHIGEQIKAADAQALDKLLGEYRQCVVRKTTFFDTLFFGRKDIDEFIDAIRLMNRR
jgi:hypothetical protein